MTSEDVFGDVVADAVLDKFETLPVGSKPQKGKNEVYHWVPLSGIVLSKGM